MAVLKILVAARGVDLAEDGTQVAFGRRIATYDVAVVSLLEDEEADAPFAHLPVEVDGDGRRWMMHTARSNVEDAPRVAGLYDRPQQIPGGRVQEVAAEVFRQELWSTFPTSSLVSFENAGRVGGGGRLWSVESHETDGDGLATGFLFLTQYDGLSGSQRKVALADVIIDPGPAPLIQGRDRGGPRMTFRPRWRGGFLVYTGGFADHVVETYDDRYSQEMRWRCRAVDQELGPWRDASSRKAAVQAYRRDYPGVGVTAQAPTH